MRDTNVEASEVEAEKGMKQMVLAVGSYSLAAASMVHASVLASASMSDGRGTVAKAACPSIDTKSDAAAEACLAR